MLPYPATRQTSWCKVKILEQIGFVNIFKVIQTDKLIRNSLGCTKQVLL